MRRKFIKRANIEKGFTLVELLVVISIIALLLAVLMPSLSKAREQAKMVICSTNQRTIILAATVYQAGNDGKYPRNMGMDEGRLPRPSGLWPNLITKDWNFNGSASDFGEKITDYLGNTVTYDTLICPLTKMPKDIYQRKKSNFLSGNDIWLYSSYNFFWNYCLMNSGSSQFVGPGIRGAKNSKILVSDLCVYSTGIRGGAWTGNHIPSGKGINKYNTLAGGVSYEVPWEAPPKSIFSMKIGVGCTDGSVVQVSTKENFEIVDFERPYRNSLYLGLPRWGVTR